MLENNLVNTCLSVLAEIKSAGNFSQSEMNRLAAAIRIKAGVILNPSIKATDTNSNSQPILEPCLECKRIADQVKIAVIDGATFDHLIRSISGIL